MAVQFHVAQGLDSEAEFAAQLAQQGDVARAAGAEHESIPDADAFDLPEVARQTADECLSWDLAESFVKPNNIRGLHAEGGDDLQLFVQRINQRRHAARRDGSIRMAVEGDYDRNALMARGVGDDLVEDALVAQVNAVKYADGRADGAPIRLQSGGIGKDLHPAGRLA